MAWIEERSRAWLVVWRDAETSKRKSLSFPWSPDDYVTDPEDDFDAGPTTREQARTSAEEFRNEVTRREARIQNAHKKLPDCIEKRFGKRPEPLFGGLYEAPEFAFETYLRRIIERDTNLRETTRSVYLIGLRVHIEGTAFGGMDIRGITPAQVTEYWHGLVDGGVGPGARRDVHLLLGKAFNRALQEGLIETSPLARAYDVKKPRKGSRADVDVLTAGQVELLADSATSGRNRLAILVMAYGGLRAGEVGGLRLQDVDFDKGILRVRQQVTRAAGVASVSGLKTPSSRRNVPIASSVLDELRAFVADEPPASDGRIFHGPNGAMWAHNAVRHAVVRAAKCAGLTGIFPHLLRHTAVSLLIDDGANPKVIQQFVGHADIKETLQTYGHLFDYGGQALAESMERRRQRVSRSAPGRDAGAA